MADVVEDIMTLWQRLPDTDEEARAAFAELYADRVQVNGNELTLDDLVARARALQSALADIRHEMIDRVEVDDKLVIAFKLHGRHTGTLRTALGEVPATGNAVSVQGMDILTFSDGRITTITVLSDELGMLSQVSPVKLRSALD
ncbi:MAG TPA: ester cyclase [Nocardioidaceae bacterium]|nr:ester cyclase [Nocardioidaceae bacterium]